ncbi:MAG: RidA family protein [Gammaproteobacteria bacterium]|nr:RidA family protein [Gammaproteobacteria bacterium]
MSSGSIQRWQGSARGRCRATAFKDLVFTVATAEGANVAEQTRRALQALDTNLADAGSARDRLLSATVYLSDIGDKAAMDEVWCEWAGDAGEWPQRACVQAALAPGTLVEITVIAARD